MKQIFLFKYYNFLLQDTYNRTLKKNGYTPLGVCWNNSTSQYNRFRVLVKLLSNFSSDSLFKLADVGCGYGELLTFLNKEKKKYIYEGYDINKMMIKYCKKKFKHQNFFLNNYPINGCDISVMSGTYNYAVTDDVVSWENYILHNLIKCFKTSNFGIVFNLQFYKSRVIKNNIYYTEISHMLNVLKHNFNHVEKFNTKELKNDVFFIIYKN